jgi:phage I-like protein
MKLSINNAIVGSDGTPEWIQLIPAGEFSGRDGRGPYILADPDEVIENTRSLDMEAGLPIDYDHASEHAATEGSPAPAAGWIVDLAARAGAVWGKKAWKPPRRN